MKSYKERVIKACRELILKYENPNGEDFFRYSTCLLCKIYIGDIKLLNLLLSVPSKLHRCKGCFQANIIGEQGCNEFISYIKALKYENSVSKNKYFQKRANYFKKIIPILEKINQKRFTPRFWSYFKEINRNW